MTGFTLPTSRPITQAWGAEFDDWDGDGTVDYPGGFYHSIGWDGHNGIDYGCFVGDPVEAVADGVVAFAGDAGNWHAILSGGGNAVLVEHPAYSVQTEYLHLSQWLVEAGQTVKKGQIIARSGATGAATAPHLHLGMLKLSGYNLNDRMRGRIDPTPYLYGNLNPDYAGGAAIAPQSTTPKELFTVGQYEDIQKQQGLTHAKLNNIAAAVNANAQQNQKWHGETHGKVNALTQMVVQLTAKQGVPITAEQIKQWSKEGAAEALAEGIVTVDVNVQGKEVA